MKERTMKYIIAVLAVLLLAGVTAYAATTYGSQDDPLITRSYLDDVLKPELEGELQTKLDAAAAELQRSASGEFSRVELSVGQTLRCAAGSELLPVSGAVSALNGLTDTTEGAAVASGTALSANHLYLAAEESGAAAAGAAVVLVSGSWHVE